MTYNELLKKYQKKETEYKNMEEEYNNIRSELDNVKIELENVKLENNFLKRKIFGKKREVLSEVDNQIAMFNDEKGSEDDLKAQEAEKTEEITVYRKKKNKSRKAGIKKSYLKDVQVINEEYDLPEEEKACPECGSDLKFVAKKIVRQEIEYEPAKLIIKRYIRNIYACKKCGTDKSNKETPTFVGTCLPKPLLTHSFVSPSLATEVIYQKYNMGVPLYRQESMWNDKGLVLPRNMMANWNIKIAEYYLKPLYELMLKRIKEENNLIHCDETTIQCNNEPGRKAESNSYMWVLCSGELENSKGVIFKYSPSRSAETAREFLKGYKNILVTDGYSSYNNVEKITHAECWAHTRRYFYDSIPLDENKKMITTSQGYKGVELCDKLFEIEREIANLSMPERLKIRKEKSKPVLDEFFEWVEKVNDKIILNNKLKKAVVYSLNQKKELSEFLNDARIPLTNSLCERAIRPFAVHRKNWLFADSVDGAKANAIMYSIIESAKLNKLNVYKYIKYLLEELPQLEELNEINLEKYMPWLKTLPEEILNSVNDTTDEVMDTKETTNVKTQKKI